MRDLLGAIAARFDEIVDLEHAGARLADLLTNVVVAAVTFLAFYAIWRVFQAISRPLLQRAKIDRTTASFVQTILKYGILTVGAAQSLTALGVNTAAILASLGVAGLTLGFAAQDTLSNIISGLLIFWDRPFVIGDLIEVGDSYGKVEKITLRSTRVVTVDGRMLAVPNSTMANTTVASYTNFAHLRVDVDVTVGLSEDFGKVRRVLLALLDGDADYLVDPAPEVVVTSLNDYNVALQFRAWLNDERLHIRKRFELREKVFVALTEAKVEMPFETLQLAPVDVVQRTVAA